MGVSADGAYVDQKRIDAINRRCSKQRLCDPAKFFWGQLSSRGGSKQTSRELVRTAADQAVHLQGGELRAASRFESVATGWCLRLG